MAEQGPAVRPPAAGLTATRVQAHGTALGRFMLIDGRPADHAWQVAEMVANFRPGTVPILSRHGGFAIGEVETLTADWRDLRFTGTLMPFPDLIERLQREWLPISIETVEGVHPRLDGRRHSDEATRPLSESKPWFRGVIDYGYNLVGIALTDRPAAPGSYLWLAAP
jgi:hypothetical protein